MVEFVRNSRDPFVDCSRRFGKTTSVLVYDIEESIKNTIVSRWCEPWKNQCREIVMTEMDKIQNDIPWRYRFQWHQTDSYYECRWNGSRIYLRGLNEDRGESARGAASHIIVMDEFGTVREPDYITNHVLRPQLLTTRGKLIRTGTPPRNLVHPYYELRDRAKIQGRYLLRTVYDQELVAWSQVEELVAEMGGWESPAVRREFLCEKIIDTNFAIIPEWKDQYIEEIPRDELYPFWIKYDALDIGVRDHTVCLLAYYDFRRARLVVLDEIVLTGGKMTTEVLAEAIRAKESFYHGVKWESQQERGRLRWRAVNPKYFRMRRVSDIDLLLVNDMSLIEGLYFEPTDKGYLEEMVNEVRIWVNAGRIAFHPRCRELIDCMRYGVWDEQRKQWERSETLGHFDALAALMYLVRNVDSRTNPVPLDYGKPAEEWWFNEDPKKKHRDKIKKLFNVK